MADTAVLAGAAVPADRSDPAIADTVVLNIAPARRDPMNDETVVLELDGRHLRNDPGR